MDMHMNGNGLAKIGDQFTQHWLDLDEVADQLDISPSGTYQSILKLTKEKKLPKNPLFVGKRGKKTVYSPQFLERLVALRGGKSPTAATAATAATKPPKSVDSVKHAVFLIQVPVFDQQVADLLAKKFGENTEAEVSKYLRDKLIEIVKPALSKIEELKFRHAAEMEEIMKSI